MVQKTLLRSTPNPQTTAGLWPPCCGYGENEHGLVSKLLHQDSLARVATLGNFVSSHSRKNTLAWLLVVEVTRDSSQMDTNMRGASRDEMNIVGGIDGHGNGYHRGTSKEKHQKQGR